MGSFVEKALTVVLVVAAVLVAASAVKNAFAPSGLGQVVNAETHFAEDWEEGIPIARRLGGNPASEIKMLILSDLECPACAGFHSRVVEPLLEDGGSELDIMFIHHPLSYHRQALPAAIAAECAVEVGAFKEWVSVVYAGQDSLGLKSWGGFAADAGIADTASFASCAGSAEAPARIDEGIIYGDLVDLKGTPTVVINGWVFGNTPSAEELTEILAAIAAGEPPPGVSSGFFSRLFGG